MNERTEVALKLQKNPQGAAPTQIGSSKLVRA